MDVLMEAPKRIKILGKTFKVVERNFEDSPEAAGLTYVTDQELHYRTDDHFEAQRDTLLHEVIHGVELQLGLELTEQQVTSLAAGLLGVLRDNKHFTRWLTAKDPNKESN